MTAQFLRNGGGAVLDFGQLTGRGEPAIPGRAVLHIHRDAKLEEKPWAHRHDR